MSDYTAAPACTMLATSCACCGRPLLDAQSVELGIGPECRRKYGYNLECAPSARAEANQLVHAVACQQSGLTVVQAAWRLRELGFSALACKIEDRAATVRITEATADSDIYYSIRKGESYLRVFTPYREDAVPAWRRIGTWRKADRCYAVPATRKADLWALLRVHFAGEPATGPRGAFQIA